MAIAAASTMGTMKSVSSRLRASAASTVLALAAALLFADTASAQLSSALGWSTIPNTKIRSVCAAENGFPQVWGAEGCVAITQQWSGGVLDSKRNRLIVFGGGHNAYYGNELYSISLQTLQLQRITDPGLPIANGCQTAIANGTQPNSRHTYDGLEYLPNVDRMFVFGGSLACGPGNFGADTWLFDFAANRWESVAATGPSPRAVPGVVTAYDPASGLVYLYDDVHLYTFNPTTRAYTRLTTREQPIGYHMAATVDPKRRKFLIVGYDNIRGAGRVWSIDINPGSSYTLTEFVTTGGAGVVGSAYPGVDYDPVQDRVVAWGENAPSNVYALNVDTGAWTLTTTTNAPKPVGNGTHGRWRYSPSSNVFVVANSVDADVAVYRASSGGGAGGGAADTSAPSVPSGVVASASGTSSASVQWSASTDNVGVANYRVLRCSGSGCSPSTVVGTPSAASFADSGLAASTTYRYSVVAVDAAGNASAGSAVATITTSAAGGGSGGATADADFAARCAAPGVIRCGAFDNTTTDIVPNVTAFPDGQGTMRAKLDTNVKASGAGALRFDLPPPPHAGANIGGSWTNQSTPVFGQTFGQNSTFYLQFRQRLSPEMVTNSWGGATWKNIIIHSGTKTCGSIELTTSNYYGTPLAQMNTDCGARHMYTTLDGGAYTETPPLLMQQGDYVNCSYGNTSAANCFYWPANEWVTVYYKIRIGTWDQPNSTIEAWVAREGETQYRQFIKVPNMSLSCNTDPCNVSPGKDQGYNNLTFTPYMTGLSGNVGPSTTAHMWIDELIVSTQPIAVPNSPPRPNPPATFSVR